MENQLFKNCEDAEVRKGPWTIEEDLILINYIANHGEGPWNSLAESAGLKRKGKSCRLRWLNYLRPDIKRGNITAEEQLLIMELHAKWGNRWSVIARHLPGRTDNQIKNYWRTLIRKQLKQAEITTNKIPVHEQQQHINYIIDDPTSHLSGCGPAGRAVHDQSLFFPSTSFHGYNNTGAFYQFPFTSDQSNDNMWTMEYLLGGP